MSREKRTVKTHGSAAVDESPHVAICLWPCTLNVPTTVPGSRTFLAEHAVTRIRAKIARTIIELQNRAASGQVCSNDGLGRESLRADAGADRAGVRGGALAHGRDGRRRGGLARARRANPSGASARGSGGGVARDGALSDPRRSPGARGRRTKSVA